MATAKPKQIGAGFVRDDGAGERFQCLTSHSVVETDGTTFGVVEQYAARGFPPQLELGAKGKILLESGPLPDVVEFSCSLVAIAEHAEARSLVVRLFLFGDDTEACREIAGKLAREWLANRMKADSLHRLLDDLRDATEDARKTLSDLRKSTPIPSVGHVLAGCCRAQNQMSDDYLAMADAKSQMSEVNREILAKNQVLIEEAMNVTPGNYTAVTIDHGSQVSVAGTGTITNVRVL